MKEQSPQKFVRPFKVNITCVVNKSTFWAILDMIHQTKGKTKNKYLLGGQVALRFSWFTFKWFDKSSLGPLVDTGNLLRILCTQKACWTTRIELILMQYYWHCALQNDIIYVKGFVYLRLSESYGWFDICSGRRSAVFILRIKLKGGDDFVLGDMNHNLV